MATTKKKTPPPAAVPNATTTTPTSNNNQLQKFQGNSNIQRPIRSTKETKQVLSDKQKECVETELLRDIADTVSKSDKEIIYNQCRELLAKISDKEQVLSMEEILQIVQDWKPKQEILCLYVRIARKLPANFHLDSISTLLCISKQCGYNPVNFLTKTKCLQIAPSGGRYGFSFTFKTVSNKTIDGNTLDRKFVGLSLTLTLLEQSVSNSCGVISRDGMRSGVPREPVSKELDLGGSSKISFKTMPSNEFHKRSSLINRLWLAINHRWMSYHLVEQLFVCKENLCEKEDILVYSFMMHASCGKSRYQFLDPMVGICFRFATRNDIEANRARLNDLWQNPSNFLTFGNNCLQRDSKERKIGMIVDTFKEMKSLFTRTSSYGRAIENDRRWLMLRAYMFSFWLKRDSNDSIRSQVELALGSAPVTTTHKSPTATVNSTTSREHKNGKTPSDLLVLDGTTIPESVCKRRRLTSTTSIDSRLWSPDAQINSKSPALQKNQNASHVVLPQERQELPLPTSTRIMLLEKDWSCIELLTQRQLDEVVASYLLIHAEGGLDILAPLTPLEVYSADRLKDFRHKRLCGPPGFQPPQLGADAVFKIVPRCPTRECLFQRVLQNPAIQSDVYQSLQINIEIWKHRQFTFEVPVSCQYRVRWSTLS
jgi:hypothetical protein